MFNLKGLWHDSKNSFFFFFLTVKYTYCAVKMLKDAIPYHGITLVIMASTSSNAKKTQKKKTKNWCTSTHGSECVRWLTGTEAEEFTFPRVKERSNIYRIVTTTTMFHPDGEMKHLTELLVALTQIVQQIQGTAWHFAPPTPHLLLKHAFPAVCCTHKWEM